MSPGGPIVVVRSFRPGDQRTCNRLYVEGLGDGSLAGNDTCADLDDIQTNYMNGRGSHFWVAEADGGEGGAAGRWWG